MMHLGRTSYMNCATARQLYLEARRKRLSGEDPQGTHPVNREADMLLIELWFPYSRARPGSGTFTMEALAAHYGVTHASVKKLVAYGYLGAQVRRCAGAQRSGVDLPSARDH